MPPPPPTKEDRVIGTRPVRPDGADKVTGRAQFGADIRLPGMLYGRIKRSPHAHAIIKKIDSSRALALPGVKGVTTAGDPLQPRDVDYEVLPPVLDVREAMAEGAPILHDDLRTRDPLAQAPPDKATNIASHMQFKRGDVEQGFAEAGVIMEREDTRSRYHHG